MPTLIIIAAFALWLAISIPAAMLIGDAIKRADRDAGE